MGQKSIKLSGIVGFVCYFVILGGFCYFQDKIVLQKFGMNMLNFALGQLCQGRPVSLERVPHVPRNLQNFKIYLMEPALRLTLY